MKAKTIMVKARIFSSYKQTFAFALVLFIAAFCIHAPKAHAGVIRSPKNTTEKSRADLCSSDTSKTIFGAVWINDVPGSDGSDNRWKEGFSIATDATTVDVTMWTTAYHCDRGDAYTGIKIINLSSANGGNVPISFPAGTTINRGNANRKEFTDPPGSLTVRLDFSGKSSGCYTVAYTGQYTDSRGNGDVTPYFTDVCIQRSQPTSRPPSISITANCSTISGSSTDPDSGGQVTIHIYKDGPAGGGGSFFGAYYANPNFSFERDTVPELKGHTIYAHPIDHETGSGSGVVYASASVPADVNCQPPPPPAEPPIVVCDGSGGYRMQWKTPAGYSPFMARMQRINGTSSETRPYSKRLNSSNTTTATTTDGTTYTYTPVPTDFHEGNTGSSSGALMPAIVAGQAYYLLIIYISADGSNMVNKPTDSQVMPTCSAQPCSINSFAAKDGGGTPKTSFGVGEPFTLTWTSTITGSATAASSPASNFWSGSLSVPNGGKGGYENTAGNHQYTINGQNGAGLTCTQSLNINITSTSATRTFIINPHVNAPQFVPPEDAPTKANFSVYAGLNFNPSTGAPAQVRNIQMTRKYYVKDKDGTRKPPFSTPVVTTNVPQAGYSFTDPNVNLPLITMGDSICVTLTANPGSGTVDNTGNVITPNPAITSREECTPIGAKPYIKVYGGDVMAGGAFGNPCTPETGNIDFSTSSGASGLVSSSSFAVLANGDIKGFASAALKAVTGTNPVANKFSFGGVTTPPGKYPLRSCLADYFGKSTGVTTPFMLPTTAQTSYYKFKESGSYTLNGLTIPSGVRILLFVDGTLTITNDIVYQNVENRTSISNIQAFFVVARHIDISPDVKELSGIYISQPGGTALKDGIIDTCTPFGPNQFSRCNQQLKVYGSFVAKTIKFRRTLGSLVDAGGFAERSNAPHPSCKNGSSTTSTCAAELFIYTPDLYLVGSPFKDSTTPKYDSFAELPPNY